MSAPMPLTTSIIVTDSVSICIIQSTRKLAEGMSIQVKMGTYQASKPLVARLMKSVMEMTSAPTVMSEASQPVRRSPDSRLLSTNMRPNRPLNTSPANGRNIINGASENVFIHAPRVYGTGHSTFAIRNSSQFTP